MTSTDCFKKLEGSRRSHIMIITTLPPSPLKILSVLVFCHNYVYCMFTSPYHDAFLITGTSKCVWGSKDIERLHIILGFLLVKISQMLSMLSGMSMPWSAKTPMQGFLISPLCVQREGWCGFHVTLQMSRSCMLKSVKIVFSVSPPVQSTSTVQWL